MPEKKQEVIKASGSIHISHKITLMQQQLWNILLANAFPDLGNKNEFSISTAELLREFPETKNTLHLKECLKELAGTVVEYNVLNKDRKEWGFFTLLAEGNIKDGVCTYSYAPGLQEKLNKPTIYAKINLLIQSHFSSKFSLFLYELFVDYKGVRQTPWMELEKFRDYIGLEEGQYLQFKDLNKWAIKPALEEINTKSDVLVKPEYKREKRKVTSLKFHIQDNPNTPANLRRPSLPLKEIAALPVASLPPESEPVQESTSPPPRPEPEISSAAPLLKELITLNISEKQATALMQKYSEEALEQAVKVVKTSHRPVRNPGGFITKALSEGWEFSESYDPGAASLSGQAKTAKSGQPSQPPPPPESERSIKFKTFLKDAARYELEKEDYEGWINVIQLVRLSQGKATIAGIPHPIFQYDIKRNIDPFFREILQLCFPDQGPFEKNSVEYLVGFH